MIGPLNVVRLGMVDPMWRTTRRVEAVCEICGGTFLVTACGEPAKYCSEQHKRWAKLLRLGTAGPHLRELIRLRQLCDAHGLDWRPEALV